MLINQTYLLYLGKYITQREKNNRRENNNVQKGNTTIKLRYDLEATIKSLDNAGISKEFLERRADLKPVNNEVRKY